MNTKKVIEQLKKEFPKSRIVENKEKGKTIEIICEVEPSIKHPEYSITIAVVDKILPHKHLNTTEAYKVVKGKLELTIDSRKYKLDKGDEIEITPDNLHWGNGEETWLKVTSTPGWTLEDHIVLA